MGHICQRGAIWWVHYYSHGRWHEESSHSSERAEAEQLLQTREVAALSAMCGAAGAAPRPNIPIAPDGRTPSIALNPRQTAALLTAVCAFVRRYVVLSDDQAVAATPPTPTPSRPPTARPTCTSPPRRSAPGRPDCSMCWSRWCRARGARIASRPPSWCARSTPSTPRFCWTSRTRP